MLRQAGASEDLKRKPLIQLARKTDNFSFPVFVKGANDLNRFSLIETVASGYGWDSRQPMRNAAGWRFPDFNRVIPVGHTKQVELDRLELLAALQRAAILSNEKFRGVRVVLVPDQLKIICTNSEQEEAEEELEVAYKGDPLDIGFNITYLLDALQNLTVERIRFAFGDANSSALVTMPDRDDYKYVVMPMRI